MEILSNSPRAPEWLTQLLHLGIAGASAYALNAIRVRVRTRKPSGPAIVESLQARPSGFVGRLSVLLGLAVAFAPSSAPAAGRKIPAPGLGPAATRPWSESSGFSPPRPLDRAWDARVVPSTDASPATGDRAGTDSSGDRAGTDSSGDRSADRAHPALHAQRDPRGRVVPLFPRAGRPQSVPESSASAIGSDDRIDAMDRHPAGKGRPRDRHVVRSGDTLWAIAERVLGTKDMARIARYWPRIHRMNRDVIGADPNLIRPGQILELPYPR